MNEKTDLFKKIKKQRELERLTKELSSVKLNGHIVDKLHQPFGVLFFPKLGEYEHEIQTNKKILLESIKLGNEAVITYDETSKKYLQIQYGSIINMFDLKVIDIKPTGYAIKQINQIYPNINHYTIISDIQHEFSEEIAKELTKDSLKLVDLLNQYDSGNFDISTYRKGKSELPESLKSNLF